MVFYSINIAVSVTFPTHLKLNGIMLKKLGFVEVVLLDLKIDRGFEKFMKKPVISLKGFLKLNLLRKYPTKQLKKFEYKCYSNKSAAHKMCNKKIFFATSNRIIFFIF